MATRTLSHVTDCRLSRDADAAFCRPISVFTASVEQEFEFASSSRQYLFGVVEPDGDLDMQSDTLFFTPGMCTKRKR